MGGKSSWLEEERSSALAHGRCYVLGVFRKYKVRRKQVLNTRYGLEVCVPHQYPGTHNCSLAESWVRSVGMARPQERMSLWGTGRPHPDTWLCSFGRSNSSWACDMAVQQRAFNFNQSALSTGSSVVTSVEQTRTVPNF